MFDKQLYRDTFSQVRASEETLAEVLNMAKRNQNNYVKRGARMLLIAAVTVGLLATTAFAYTGFTRYENPLELLKTFFGVEEYTLKEGRTFTYQDADGNKVVADLPDSEKVPVDEKVAEEDVAPYVSAVGQTLTHKDYSLTVEAHLYDSATDCGIVYYTLENPGGVIGYALQYDGEVWWPGGELVPLRGAGGKAYLIEEETTENKLSVAVYYCAEESSIRLGFFDDEVTLPLDDGGGMECLTLAEGDIALSPISMRITVTDMDYLWLREDGTVSPSIYCTVRSLVIRYRDGTEYVVECEEPYINNTAYALVSYDGSLLSYSFNRMVDLEQVEAVVINGVEYTDVQPVPQAQRDTVSTESLDLPAATEPANP